MTQPIVTPDDLAGLIAVAEFLEHLGIDTDAPAQLRALAQRLSALVILPADG